MRYVVGSIMALASLATANPLGYNKKGSYNAYPTGGQPASSTPVGYLVPTPSSFTSIYPASSSSSAGYAVQSSMSPISYKAQTSSTTRGSGYFTSSSFGSSVSTPVSSDCETIVPSSSSRPYGTGSSASLPASSSSGTIVPSTSSIPYGTGYYSNALASTTPYASYETSPPLNSTSTPYSASSYPLSDITTTVTITTYIWIPCSTPVGQSGYSTIFSTYLTASYVTRTMTSAIWGCGGKSCVTGVGAAPSYSAAYPSSSMLSPVSSSVALPPPPPPPASTSVRLSVSASAPGGCPAPVVVTKTVYVEVPVTTTTDTMQPTKSNTGEFSNMPPGSSMLSTPSSGYSPRISSSSAAPYPTANNGTSYVAKSTGYWVY